MKHKKIVWKTVWSYISIVRCEYMYLFYTLKLLKNVFTLA